MRKAIIILSIILGITIIINLVFALFNPSPSSPLPTPTSPNTLPSSLFDNPTEQDIDSIIAALEKNSTSESPPLPAFTMPTGFRFPENANLTEKTPLEIILPGLQPDPQTKRMDELERDLLHFRLSQSYSYDPVSQNIVSDSNYQVQTAIIDFGVFDPDNLEVKTDENVLWFNQNTTACQLRTDPKSPERINQTIESQKSIVMKLTSSGIYIFYCQDNPANTQTIVVI